MVMIMTIGDRGGEGDVAVGTVMGMGMGMETGM